MGSNNLMRVLNHLSRYMEKQVKLWNITDGETGMCDVPMAV